jgi:hypothetical protein
MTPAVNRAAPRAEFSFPPRSRVAAITGAPSGVEIVAAEEPDQRGEDRAVGPVEPGPRIGPPQHGDLVP